MLTGSNQYLRPDYLSPLPTTLDAKKSPLALLAQTCSNIGADTPSTKPLLPPVEKPKESEKKSSSVSPPDDKSSFKPYESVKKEENTQDGSSERTGFRTPTSKSSSSPAVSTSTSHNSGKVTPSTSSSSSSEGSAKVSSSLSDASCTTTVTSAITHPLSSAALHSQHNRISIGCGNMFVEVNHHESALPKDGGLSSHLPLGSYKTSGQLLPPSGMLGSLANCTGCTQVVGPHVDAANSQSFAQSLAASQKGFPAGSGLSPYVAYARVKTATGGTTLVPICRDPYCTNCQFSVQSAQLVGASCPSGCTQCTHEKAAAGLAAAAAAAAASPLSSLSLVPGAGGPASAAQLYSHSMLSHRPYVCNWIAGDTYCGKRFGTSEELLQHLRTHTNLSASDAASLPLLNPALSLPSAAQSLACHLHYSNAPSLTTMAGLHRTYPTSLSPVGSLSSSRYHPYKPPYPPIPGTPFAPMAPHPGFGPPYYSPYAMYGQRIGAAVHP